MTVLEAIQSNPILANVPVEYIESLMVGRAIDGSTTYEASSLKELELVTADLYAAIATLPEFKEGQLSIKYDAQILKNRALSIYSKYDDPKADEFRLTPINVNVSNVDA